MNENQSRKITKYKLPSLGKMFPSAISRCSFFGNKPFLQIENHCL